MRNAIGGYFELELRKGEHYHKDALRLNTARNCFEYILLVRKYRKVYIPYFTCEVMLQPLLKHHIAYEFYSINKDLEPIEAVKLKSDEAFLYTNYFGIKQSCVERLSEIYKSRLIIDNAQAFYSPRIEGIDTFYSPRKFFGVPDGGYLYTDCLLDDDFPQDKSGNRMQHLICRIEDGAEAGYQLFRQNEDKLDASPILKMSELTSRLLENIDYNFVRDKRRENFQYLHEYLGKMNELKFEDLQSEVPMVYPFYQVDNGLLRKHLIQNNIYVATYWPNVIKWCATDSWEINLTQNLCALSIDQRYGKCDMLTVKEEII